MLQCTTELQAGCLTCVSRVGVQAASAAAWSSSLPGAMGNRHTSAPAYSAPALSSHAAGAQADGGAPAHHIAPEAFPEDILWTEGATGADAEVPSPMTSSTSSSRHSSGFCGDSPAPGSAPQSPPASSPSPPRPALVRLKHVPNAVVYTGASMSDVAVAAHSTTNAFWAGSQRLRQ